MSLIVQKFGGSSVRDYAHLLRMARIVKSRVDEGDDVVVVLSAQGDTTDGLLQKAKEISESPSPREARHAALRGRADERRARRDDAAIHRRGGGIPLAHGRSPSKRTVHMGTRRSD